MTTVARTSSEHASGPRLVEDRVLSPDIEALAAGIAAGEFVPDAALEAPEEVTS